MRAFDQTCLAYAVSEPGQWTNTAIWEDLGGPTNGSLTTIVQAVTRLRRAGLIDPICGLRVMPDSGAVGLFFDIERRVFEIIRTQQPVKHAEIAKAADISKKEVSRIVRKMVRLGLVAPSGRLWPTAKGIAALSP